MRLLLLGLLFWGVGCQAVSDDRVQGTIEAGNAFYATEAAQIGLSSIEYETQAVATIQMKESELAVVRNVNQQIAATVAVSSSPTPSLILGAAAPSSGRMDSGPEEIFDLQREAQFTITGISETVRDSDDCVTNPSRSFQAGTVDRLYLTFVATNLHIDSPLRGEWYFNGALVTADEWIVSRNYPQACFWFVIDTNDTSFPTGLWSAQLIQFGNPVGTPLEFTIDG